MCVDSVGYDFSSEDKDWLMVDVGYWRAGTMSGLFLYKTRSGRRH
jgi:hypothetical protein